MSLKQPTPMHHNHCHRPLTIESEHPVTASRSARSTPYGGTPTVKSPASFTWAWACCRLEPCWTFPSAQNIQTS